MNLEVCDIQLSKSKGRARNGPAFVILVEVNFLYFTIPKIHEKVYITIINP
jgi:hypothetical protein